MIPFSSTYSKRWGVKNHAAFFIQAIMCTFSNEGGEDCSQLKVGKRIPDNVDTTVVFDTLRARPQI